MICPTCEPFSRLALLPFLELHPIFEDEIIHLENTLAKGSRNESTKLPGIFTGRVSFRGSGRARVTRPDPTRPGPARPGPAREIPKPPHPIRSDPAREILN